MKRREFIAATAAAAASVAVGHPAVSAAKRKTPGRPNILFIMTDQQSAGMMSCAGNKWLKTPAADRIAASGVRFERAYACNPVCLPNRFSLQTGLMPSAVGVGRNEDGSRAPVTEAMVAGSLGNWLSKAGYEAVYGGKTHLPPRMRVRKLGYRNLTGNSRQGLADACAKFIKARHDPSTRSASSRRAGSGQAKPFFLFASFINPHDICYMAINAYRRMRGGRSIRNIDSKTCEAILDRARKSDDLAAFVEKHCPALPDNHAVPGLEPECITLKYMQARPFRRFVRDKWTEQDWRLHRWAYCRLTEMVDAKIAKLLDAVRDAGLEDNTLIVFTSDHGDMDSAHKMEHKSVLYEESVRVPFLMSFKGVIPKGKVDDRHLISNGLDLLPTLCDYAGIETPGQLPGRSVRAIPEGKSKKPAAWRDHVVVESQNGRMVRTDRFKYCIYDSGKHREQLTDLKNDPGEMKNLAASPDHSAELARHRRLLADWIKKTGDRIGAKYVRS